MILHRCSKKGEILSWSLTGVKGLKQGNSINSHLQISGTNNSQLLMLACASYFPHENIFHYQRKKEKKDFHYGTIPQETHSTFRYQNKMNFTWDYGFNKA